MKTDIQNLDGIVDQSLKLASRVIAVIAFPAILFAAYRNLAIDFLPYHQAFLTIDGTKAVGMSKTQKP